MTEEKKEVTNGPAKSEMAPQEDGTKVPLTNDAAEVKFTSQACDDARIDMGPAQTFSGLSKDELMKYADDPFWVRLRWALFILFWLGWMVMLVLAIVIIVHAPSCPTKEKLEWVQESAMVQYDINNPVDANGDNQKTPEDLIKIASELGMSTVYLEDLINPVNFSEINTKYIEKDVTMILEAAKENNYHVVTDFVPTTVDPNNTWATDPSMTGFFKPGTKELDFTNETLISTLVSLLGETWHKNGIQGFLIPSGESIELRNASVTLNDQLESVDGAVVYGETDMRSLLGSNFNAEKYQTFLDQSMNEWAYFKYNPRVAESTLDLDLLQLVTLSLFLVPGTPIMDGIDEAYFKENSGFIKSLSDLREKESIKLGNITFVESNPDVIAYARLTKGTPGYAVAVNMASNTANVSFTSIAGVPDRGINQLQFFNSTLMESVDSEVKLGNLQLRPYEGIVLEFVPDL